MSSEHTPNTNPPSIPPYTTAPQPTPTTPKSVTVTFPVIKGKLAAFLYVTTLLLLAVIAWAQVTTAITTSDAEERYKLNYCAGDTYGAENYTQAEKDMFSELCGHAPRTDDDDEY